MAQCNCAKPGASSQCAAVRSRQQTPLQCMEPSAAGLYMQRRCCMFDGRQMQHQATAQHVHLPINNTSILPRNNTSTTRASASATSKAVDMLWFAVAALAYSKTREALPSSKNGAGGQCKTFPRSSDGAPTQAAINAKRR